jgi:hypothetical protein
MAESEQPTPRRDELGGEVVPFSIVEPIWREAYEISHSGAWTAEHKRRFAGAVMERVIDKRLADEFAAEGRIEDYYGPDEVVQVYTDLNPDAEIVEHAFGTRGIEGISVPDALVLHSKDNVMIVEEVIQITSSLSRRHASKVKRVVETMAHDKASIFEGIDFSSATLRYIIPQGTRVIPVLYELIDEVGGRIDEAWFTYDNLQEYVNFLLGDFEPEPGIKIGVTSG